MDKNQMEGKWEQLKGHVKATWGRLTDHEILLLRGDRDQFFGKLQEKYGILREEAESKVRQLQVMCE